MSTASHPFAAETHSADGFMRGVDLACRHGLRPVFGNLSFDLKAGQALALYGANGSGKTSLLRIVAGLVPASAGGISPPPLPQNMHYLGHMDGLKPALSVGETLAMTAGLYGAETYDEAALLALLGLSGRAGQRVGDLSAGQKRRLALARLVMAPRPLWLLDEPLTALDRQGRALISELATTHLGRQGMIMAASHEPLEFASHSLSLDAFGIASGAV